jgi:hypothetical protein
MDTATESNNNADQCQGDAKAMSTILFVHGTGVRRQSFDATLATLRDQAAAFDRSMKFEGCFWGGPHGVRMPERPASIPTFDQTMAAAGTLREDTELVLWDMLYRDPLFELRLIAQAPGERRPLAPNQKSPATILSEKLARSRDSPELKTVVRQGGFDDWQDTVDEIHRSAVFRDSLQAPIAGAGAHRLAVARGVVATLTAKAIECQLPIPSAASRDDLVDRIVGHLGGNDMGPIDIVTKPLIGLASRFATWKIRRNRGKYTSEGFEALGDILLYQVRGDEIRAFIRQSIETASRRAQERVVVLAHSLGGIACVDLFAEIDAPDVRGLATAGSQAPFLYEIDALSSRRYGATLPDAFPRWMNFYDLNDPLSYIGRDVFPQKVRDMHVQSGQPFPASHSAYWLNQTFWKEFTGFVRGLPA